MASLISCVATVPPIDSGVASSADARPDVGTRRLLPTSDERNSSYGNPPFTTAVGGQQRIRIFDGAEPLWDPFEALAMGPAFSITSTSAPFVTVRGEVPGSATMRITGLTTREFFGSFTLAVAPITSIGVSIGRVVQGGAINLQRGYTAQVGFALQNGETILADRDTTSESTDTTILRVTPTSLYAASLEAIALGSAELTVVAGGGRHRAAVVNVVDADAIEAIRPGPGDTFPAIDRPIPEGTATAFCFFALVRGERLLGARFSYSVAGGSLVDVLAGSEDCVYLTPRAPDPFEFIVHAESADRRFAITVVPR